MANVIISFIIVLGWLLHAYILKEDKYVSIDYLVLRVMLIIEIPFTVLLVVQGEILFSLINGILIIIIIVAMMINRVRRKLI